jgi:glycerol-3-phosphate O-acyltransferase
LRNADEIEDVILVPITINYDKVYEGEAFPYELLGEEKPKETLMKILKQLVMTKERQGRAIIKYCKPISLKTMIEGY